MKLHLVNDEKIINRTIDMFEQVFPGDNLWVVDTKKSEFKWVERREGVISTREFYENYKDGSFDAIYIHYLNRHKMNLINKIDTSRSTVYWIIWGADLYNKLLAPKGFRLFADGTWGAAKKIGFFNRWVKRRKAQRNVDFIQNKVDCIVTDTTDNDYDYLVKYYPQLSGKRWLDFFYYPIDVILGKELMDASTNGNGIMVGNSASTTNNHQYVFDILSRFDLGSRKVTVPLSYNGNPEYIKEVCATGHKLLGDNFNPLMEFMPLDKYNLLQSSTGYAFFGNLRQEAIGNVLIVVYLGAKVFLCRSNPVYEWACSKGLKVFDIESLTQEELDTPLDEESRRKNRDILLKLYSRERLLSLIAGLAPIKTMNDEGADS